MLILVLHIEMQNVIVIDEPREYNGHSSKCDTIHLAKSGMQC